MNHKLDEITARIIERSKKTRTEYLKQVRYYQSITPQRSQLSCGNLAHSFAACSLSDKKDLSENNKANIGIISAYNDLLSAHQPYETYPALIKQTIHSAGGIAQFAGGVPAMCDGITQGQAGMELSLLSRDVIALSTVIALSHQLFDGVLMLGICDKIVPGLLMAALQYGHLPTIFIPAGPMPSGISNQEKAKVRQEYAQGKVDRAALLKVESQSYHSPGTCTFYGTANSNQLLMEIMGLQLPGSSFVNPEAPLRDALTQAAAKQILQLKKPIGEMINEKSIVNAIVGLLATGGSTNHTMHLVAIAKSAGIEINWDDFSALSKLTPLITKVYPNGMADINIFQNAGGMAYLIHTLLDAQLLHEDAQTILGTGLNDYTKQPQLDNNELIWIDGPKKSSEPTVLTASDKPFNIHGGLQLMTGNLGRAVMKTSAVKKQHLTVEAPAIIFSSQADFEAAFKAGKLDKDCVVVMRFQGPRACGMPELHQLTPYLSVLQDKGFRVALVTDGRMSGASGKVPAAIHVTPEAIDPESILAKLEDSDMILVDGENGFLQVMVSDHILSKRQASTPELASYRSGLGRNLFNGMRQQFTGAEQGACSLFNNMEDNHASS